MIPAGYIGGYLVKESDRFVDEHNRRVQASADASAIIRRVNVLTTNNETVEQICAEAVVDWGRARVANAIREWESRIATRMGSTLDPHATTDYDRRFQAFRRHAADLGAVYR